MFIVYILYSKRLNRHYIGHAEDLDIRLGRHNRGLIRSTKSGIPWMVIHTELYKTKNLAYKRELQIKRYKGGEAFKKLVNK